MHRGQKGWDEWMNDVRCGHRTVQPRATIEMFTDLKTYLEIDSYDQSEKSAIEFRITYNYKPNDERYKVFRIDTKDKYDALIKELGDLADRFDTPEQRELDKQLYMEGWREEDERTKKRHAD